MTEDVAGYLRLVTRAEARTAGRKWAEAAGLWDQVVAHNPVNGTYWGHLARARFELADFAAALAAFEQVLRLGVRCVTDTRALFPDGSPYLIPAEVSYQIACCHARLGDAERALAALADALRRGFRDLDRPLSDDHCTSLRDDDRLREVLGIVDVDGLSRDQGWRADLRLLARETRRRAWGLHGPAARELDDAVACLDREIPALTDAQIVIGMNGLLRKLGDGHAFVAPAHSKEHQSRGAGDHVPVPRGNLRDRGGPALPAPAGRQGRAGGRPPRGGGRDRARSAGLPRQRPAGRGHPAAHAQRDALPARAGAAHRSRHARDDRDHARRDAGPGVAGGRAPAVGRADLPAPGRLDLAAGETADPAATAPAQSGRAVLVQLAGRAWPGLPAVQQRPRASCRDLRRILPAGI